MKNDVIVGLGSNIDPDLNIEKAIHRIRERFVDIDCSRLVETDPIGFKDQARFCNGAVRFKTDLISEDLKQWLLNVETDFGRVRTENKNGPRTIDLDILIWNSEIVDEDVYGRDFLQSSIQELWPGLLEKKTATTLKENADTG